MPSSAAALPISADDQAVLRRWANATQAPAALVRRAEILLLAAAGVANTEIAERLGLAHNPGRPPPTPDGSSGSASSYDGWPPNARRWSAANCSNVRGGRPVTLATSSVTVAAWPAANSVWLSTRPSTSQPGRPASASA
jgi:hypothetical protein